MRKYPRYRVKIPEGTMPPDYKCSWEGQKVKIVDGLASDKWVWVVPANAAGPKILMRRNWLQESSPATYASHHNGSFGFHKKP